MPNTENAKKRLRQSLVRRTRNRAAKAELRTRIRKVLEHVKSGDAAASETEFRLTVKKLDKAASGHVIHANRAARLKSRLTHRLKAAKAKAS